MQTSEFIYSDNIFDNIIPTGNGGATSLSYKVCIDNKQYFMKRLRPELQKNQRCRSLFYKEFEIGINISNKYVVKYDRICEEDNELYILMEYVYGSTVEELFNTNKSYFAKEQNLWKFILQLLEGIKAFHDQGVVYLDISPANIMLTQVGNNVKIVDLGFCFNNAYGHTAGRTSLFAPDEISNINEIDERSDIYAIGRLMKYIQEKSGTRYSRRFNRIVERCTKEEKEKRFGSTDEIINTIRHCNRHRSIWLSTLSAVFVCAVFFVFFYTGQTIDTVSLNGVNYSILSKEDSTCEVTGGQGDEWNIYIAGHAIIDGQKYHTTQIAKEAFKNTPVKSVFLPEGLETICYHAFADCDSIVTIYIPGSVKEIGAAFCGMRGLKSVRIPAGLSAINTAAFAYCSALTDIEIPEGVERICLDAFAECSALKNVHLPQSLKVIERGSFWKCKALEEITIPAGVCEIGDYAFYNCPELKDVYNYALEPQEITMIFNSDSVTVHVPAQSLDAYKKDFKWQKYNLVGDL